MNYLLVVQVFVRTPTPPPEGQVSVKINSISSLEALTEGSRCL